MERRTPIYNNGQEKLVFLLYLALLVWLPIPLGSNREWAWSLFEVTSSLLMIWTIVLVITGRTTVSGIVPYMKWVLVLIFASVALQLFQLYPIGAEIMETLSPRHIELLTMLEPNQITLSIDKNESIQSILKQLSYFGLFFVSLVLLADRRRIRLLLLTIATGGVFQAVLAISQWITLSSMGTGLENVMSVSGTFVNKNHFAAYLNMTIACIVGLLLFDVYLGNTRGAARPNRNSSLRNVLLAFLTIVVFALVITRSRGAGLAFIVSMLGLILSFSLNPVGPKKLGRYLFLVAALSIGVSVTLGYKTISDRIANIEQDLSTRTEIWALTGELIRDFPLLGIGVGNYSKVIPLYENKNLGVSINHAHNDYLEMLAEQGIVGFSIFSLIMLFCLLYALRTILRSDDASVLIITGVGLFGVVSMLVHSMLDFNFYIPSNAAYFYVFLALMVSNAHRVKKRRHKVEISPVQVA